MNILNNGQWWCTVPNSNNSKFALGIYEKNGAIGKVIAVIKLNGRKWDWFVAASVCVNDLPNTGSEVTYGEAIARIRACILDE